MDILRRARTPAKRIAVLSGTFNPPTRAHLALAGAALHHAGEILFVLPKTLPHKTFDGASFDERLEMVLRATAGHPQYSVGASEGGLFAEIARECRDACAAEEVNLICGRDAAERIAGWDYAGHPSFAQQLSEYSLLVAARQGEYVPPVELARRIEPLAFNPEYEAYSASEVRRLAAEVGGGWEEMVPEPIVTLVRRIYAGGGRS